MPDMADASSPKQGRVYLVGAGPGDPGLITLRGVECLRRADLVLYDYLVNSSILQHLRPGAEAICLGRHGGGRLMSQQEVNERLVSAARLGKTVVRLKAGDPAIFARAAEEIEYLSAAGISFEVVPGITAAFAAGSYAGIPLTHRDAASAVALVTGHEQDEKREPALDYAALAVFPGTLVFYMGVTSAPVWTQALLDAGKAADTPAAIVRRCSWPDQTTVRCRLDEVAGRIVERRIRPPALVVVGPVAALQPTVSWFANRPLFGRRVLVTRPDGRHAERRADPLAERLQELGAEVLVQPAIEISEPQDWAPVDRALRKLDDYDWLVFSSANGVRFLLERICQKHGDLRRLGRIRLAVIGPGTAEALQAYRLKPDAAPSEFRAEALAEALAPLAAGRRFLLVRASRGREVLAERLIAAGGQVDQIVAYRSTDVDQANPEIEAALAAGRVDWITVTSSAIARSLVSLFGDKLRRAKLASISPVTSATLVELGHPPAAEAVEYTLLGVAEAILAHA
ncbi:MAG TPA: uroporphyrinogen-III C-methyltransferase [Pirellulales bacterium]|jgi:uroporphyrinogen III methyltransferase/synthase|nr:uroporphyrinogen-III C-methyltransferase [Pirellulales bacterium]